MTKYELTADMIENRKYWKMMVKTGPTNMWRWSLKVRKVRIYLIYIKLLLGFGFRLRYNVIGCDSNNNVLLSWINLPDIANRDTVLDLISGQFAYVIFGKKNRPN